MNTQILYCPKCGWIEYPSPFQQSDNYCEVCGHDLLIPNDKYDLNLKNYMNGININTGRTFKQNQQRLFEEVIKPNPEFDPDLYARKDEIIKQAVGLLRGRHRHGVGLGFRFHRVGNHAVGKRFFGRLLPLACARKRKQGARHH